MLNKWSFFLSFNSRVIFQKKWVDEILGNGFAWQPVLQLRRGRWAFGGSRAPAKIKQAKRMGS